ncbi:MAG: OsmC family protein [Candidatus Omnitrophica bacterium]|nr:OsmC family protein [Candidatus Omnitrophota bacterium]
MVKVDITYEGNLHCSMKHGPSGSVVATDAPKDNMGKGEAFSPTDLVASALGSCILTTLGIVAGRHHLKLDGAKAEVTKEMSTDPRRIARITVTIQMPAGIPLAQRPLLEHAGHSCPVHKSLHPDIEMPIQINYPD